MRNLVLLLAVSGCSTPVIETATCVPQADNALRADCSVTVGEDPAAIEVRFASDDGTDVRTVARSDVANTHAFSLVGLLPEQTYTFTALVAGDEEGLVAQLDTPAVPEDLGSYAVTGESALELVALPVLCGTTSYAVVVDTAGRVRWYQELRSEQDYVPAGFDVTAAGTFLVILDDEIEEYTPAGERVFHVARGTDFDLPVHHAVTRTADGRTLALNADVTEGSDGESYVLDGVYVFDVDGTLTDSWSAASVVDPSDLHPPDIADAFWAGDFPGAHDWMRANSLVEDAAGNWVMSLKRRASVWSVDPTGAVRWVLGGDPAVPDAPHLAVTEGTDVDGAITSPIDARLSAEGTLTLLDGVGSDAPRTLAFDLDEGASTATATESHPIDEACLNFGGVVPLADGGELVTCTPPVTVAEFAPGAEAAVRWTLDLTCPDGSGGTTVRALPYTFPE